MIAIGTLATVSESHLKIAQVWHRTSGPYAPRNDNPGLHMPAGRPETQRRLSMKSPGSLGPSVSRRKAQIEPARKPLIGVGSPVRSPHRSADREVAPAAVQQRGLLLQQLDVLNDTMEQRRPAQVLALVEPHSDPGRRPGEDRAPVGVVPLP